MGSSGSWAFSGAEDEEHEILRSGSGTQTWCCRPLDRFLPSHAGQWIVGIGILPNGDAQDNHRR
jgi:hypothetical protein